ncbi:MAG: hypothetical protein ACXAD7_09270 [Candidatus Kariarchaeaceae archaeon]
MEKIRRLPQYYPTGTVFRARWIISIIVIILIAIIFLFGPIGLLGPNSNPSEPEITRIDDTTVVNATGDTLMVSIVLNCNYEGTFIGIAIIMQDIPIPAAISHTFIHNGNYDYTFSFTSTPDTFSIGQNYEMIIDWKIINQPEHYRNNITVTPVEASDI